MMQRLLFVLAAAAYLAVGPTFAPQPTYGQPSPSDGAEDRPVEEGDAAESDDDDGEEDPLSAWFRENVRVTPELNQRLARGRTALAEGDAAEAIRHFRFLRLQSPNHIIARHLLVLGLIAEDEPVEALREIHATIAIYPDFPRLAWPIRRLAGATFSDIQQPLDQLDRIIAGTDEPPADDAEGAADDGAELDDGPVEDRAERADPFAALDEGDQQVLRGYLHFFLESFDEAHQAWLAADRADRTRTTTWAFLTVLNQLGYPWSPDGVTEGAAFVLGRDRLWLLPGLRSLAAEEWETAVLRFGDAIGLAGSDEPFAWIAIAMIAADRPSMAAPSLRRAIGSADDPDAGGVWAMPRASDLLPAELLAARREAWLADGATAEQRLLAGWLLYLEAEVARSRDALTPVGRDAANPYADTARALLEALPGRTDPPRLDLTDLPTEAEATAEPTVDAGGETTQPDAGTNPDELTEATVEERVEEAMRAGNDALDAEEYDAALEAYQTAEQIGLSFDEAYFDTSWRADLYLRKAQVQFALAEFTGAEESLARYLSHTSPGARAQKARFVIRLPGSLVSTQAEILVDRIANRPGDSRSRFLLAYLLYSLDEVQASYEQFRELDPDVVPAGSHAASRSALVRFFLDTLREQGATEPDPQAIAAAALEAGQAQIRESHYQAAIPLLVQAYEIREDVSTLTPLLVAQWGQVIERSADGELILGTARERINAFQSCASLLRTFLRSRETMEALIRNPLRLSDAFPTVSAYRRALSALAAHRQDRPLDGEAHYVAAFVHFFSGEYAQAVEAFDAYRDYAESRNEEVGPEFHAFRAAAEERSP